MRTTILAVLAVALLMAGGCKKEEPKTPPATGGVQDQANSLLNGAQDKAAEFQKDFAGKMDQWGTQISATAEKVKASADEKAKELQTQLTGKYDQAKAKLAELKDATAEQRAKLQADLTMLGADIQKLYEQVKEKVGG
ncbi:MAG: hypothetical protein ACYC26_09360 [Phycisphaerales bacterium]